MGKPNSELGVLDLREDPAASRIQASRFNLFELLSFREVRACFNNSKLDYGRDIDHTEENHQSPLRPAKLSKTNAKFELSHHPKAAYLR